MLQRWTWFHGEWYWTFAIDVPSRIHLDYSPRRGFALSTVFAFFRLFFENDVIEESSAPLPADAGGGLRAVEEEEDDDDSGGGGGGFGAFDDGGRGGFSDVDDDDEVVQFWSAAAAGGGGGGGGAGTILLCGWGGGGGVTDVEAEEACGSSTSFDAAVYAADDTYSVEDIESSNIHSPLWDIRS